MKEITLYSNNAKKKLSDKEIEVLKHNEIAVFLRDFIIDQNVLAKDRIPLMIAFDNLKPRDLTDAFYCAHIVYCQQIIKELNDYRHKYQKFEMTNKTSSKKYQWALREYSNTLTALSTMIKDRAKHNLET